MTRSVIITCAVTRSLHTPSMSPHLPLTPDEIAVESIAAAEAGLRSSICMRVRVEIAGLGHIESTV